MSDRLKFFKKDYREPPKLGRALAESPDGFRTLVTCYQVWCGDILVGFVEIDRYGNVVRTWEMRPILVQK
jgi:hypothetical protein